MALSSTKYEYIALTEAIKEAIWLHRVLRELKVYCETSTMFGDNQSALHLCKNPMFHERTKRMDVRYHFIQEKVADGLMKIKKISLQDNPANVGTKALWFSKFKNCLELLKVGNG